MNPLSLREPYDERESRLLAPYAMRSEQSQGRVHPEPRHPYRGPFQRDRDRIVHSAAYRRLSSKTQVFMGEMGDYHRTRLTHTLEVALIARTLARALALNEDLAEALALLHDIGHPPFGHAGEDVLDECLAVEGGFNHNRQAIRIVELLETRYPNFPGLNLSLEVLEGQRYRAQKDRSAARPLLEVQIVDAADGVAYSTHDADDALELGLIDLDEIAQAPLWKVAAGRVQRRYADLEGDVLRRAVLHELIEWQVGDLLEQTGRRLDAESIESVEAVASAEWLVTSSGEVAELRERFQDFLHERVYRHAQVVARRKEAQHSLHRMFRLLTDSPERMSIKFQRLAGEHGSARVVADYLSGMTDRFALAEHARLFSG
jgi:dGTPase